MRRFLCLLAVLILGIATAGCRQEPTKRYTADELTGMSGSELLAVLSDNGLSLPDGVAEDTAEGLVLEVTPKFLKGETDACTYTMSIDYDGTIELIMRTEAVLRQMGLCRTTYTEDALKSAGGHYLLKLFEANGLTVDTSLREAYTDTQLEDLFLSDFSLLCEGKTSQDGAGYRDLAKQTAQVYQKLTKTA